MKICVFIKFCCKLLVFDTLDVVHFDWVFALCFVEGDVQTA